MNRRVIIAAVVALAAFLAASWLPYWLADDATRIRMLVEECAAAFNDGSRSGCLEGFAEDFVDETSKIDRELLGRALAYLFLKEKHAETGQLRYRIEIDPKEFPVTVESDGDAAKIPSVAVRFLRLRAGSYEPAWTIDVECELAKIDGRWRIRRTRHDTQDGRRPF